MSVQTVSEGAPLTDRGTQSFIETPYDRISGKGNAVQEANIGP